MKSQRGYDTLHTYFTSPFMGLLQMVFPLPVSAAPFLRTIVVVLRCYHIFTCFQRIYCLFTVGTLVNQSLTFVSTENRPSYRSLPLVINDFFRYTHLEIENVVHTREDLASIIALQLGRRCLCIGKREQ